MSINIIFLDGGGGERGTNGESSINMHTLLGVRRIAGEKLMCSIRSPVWCSVMAWRDGMREWREPKERGDVRHYG